ncbi:acetyl-CoA carboxylase biotin carboxyl carrier protein [bacterium]|nr:acetyl-CoA carboxylase biotin carboxyl carrier protein [bacterium]
MDLDRLKEVIAIFQEAKLDKLEIKEGDVEIVLEKGMKVAPVAAATQQSSFSPMKELSDINLEKTIDAPMVGSFYRASSPSAKPFVKVGDRVKKGDILCVIEAMKVMNEVKAEQEGLIKEIMVEDGESVDFGKPLFTVE